VSCIRKAVVGVSKQRNVPVRRLGICGWKPVARPFDALYVLKYVVTTLTVSRLYSVDDKMVDDVEQLMR
jgi:hypothetical protein